MSMLTALQAATVIASQSLFVKLSVTMGLRVWQMLAPDKTAQAKLESDQPWIQRVKAAQLNEAEYAPLFVALLVFSRFSSSLSSSSSPFPVTLGRQHGGSYTSGILLASHLDGISLCSHGGNCYPLIWCFGSPLS